MLAEQIWISKSSFGQFISSHWTPHRRSPKRWGASTLELLIVDFIGSHSSPFSPWWSSPLSSLCLSPTFKSISFLPGEEITGPKHSVLLSCFCLSLIKIMTFQGLVHVMWGRQHAESLKGELGEIVRPTSLYCIVFVVLYYIALQVIVRPTSGHLSTTVQCTLHLNTAMFSPSHCNIHYFIHCSMCIVQ